METIFDNREIPLRMSSPNEAPILTKEEDPKHKQPILVKDAYAKVFNLSDDKDVEAYNKVFSDHFKGRTYIGMDEVKFHEGVYYAFVRWYELFIENPKKGERNIVYR